MHRCLWPSGPLRLRPWLAALVLPIGLRLGDALPLAFKHDVPLKRSDTPEHGQHQLAGRSARVDAQVQDAKGRSQQRNHYRV